MKNRIYSFLLLYALVITATAQTVTPNEVTFDVNRQYVKRLSIKLSGGTEYNALSFRLDLPAGISTSSLETDIDANHKWDSEGNKYMYYSDQNNPLEDKTIVSFSLHDALGIFTGKVRGYLRDVQFSTKDCQLVTLDDIPVVFNFPDRLLGDVNLDGQLNVADCNKLAQYLLGKDPYGFCEPNANVNEDGEVTIADLVELINRL